MNALWISRSSDLSLPGSSGIDLIRALRNDKRTGDVRIAVYTASVRDRALDDFVQIYRIAALLPKPGEPAELLAAIEMALRASIPCSGKSLQIGRFGERMVLRLFPLL